MISRKFSSRYRPVIVATAAPQILLHPSDCERNGVSIMTLRGLQISGLDEFGDHLSGGGSIGRLSDVAHGFSSASLGCAWQLGDESKPGSAPSLTLVGELSFAGMT
jgi:hypothetical protein